MNVTPNVPLDRIEEADFKIRFQYPKCLNEEYLDELAGYISASASDMCSLSVNPADKCAILQETVNKICQINLAEDCDDLQKSEVSSSKPSLFGNDLVGPILLQALDGFLFMVNTEGKIEFVTANVKKFLKYSQESLIDKTIYNIIHVGDHARFSSNLLPMSIGNGFGWSEPSSHSRSFNCRFLIKPPEDQEETMEEKQTRVSHYENMHISAVLLPQQQNDIEAADIQNHLVCVARRLPPNEKNNTPGVENFLTRLDLHGKIISIDTSGVSAAFKDLIGQNILELTHPDDVQKVTQHLKETLQQGSHTSGVYRLSLQQKVVHVQTRSKRCEESILANHTLLRDSDHCLENVVSPSPAASASNMNGNAFSFAAMSSPEFLSDIGLDFLPSSSWDLNEEALGGPSNNNAPRSAQHFSPDLLPASASPPAGTPFSGAFPFSPGRTSSPAPLKDHASPGDQKLRNLLTQGMEEADSSKKAEENGENIILRELLNQEEDDPKTGDPLEQKRTVNNNNMLRKLLNNDESYKKDQNEDIIQELLKNEKSDPESMRKVLSLVDNNLKRKTPDTPTEDPLAKRQNTQHAHLAGQNPMLASMLAQTPRTSPSVPTSVANAIVSQLPQERLPKNLEKKLVHTPYTSAPGTSTSSGQYSFARTQEVVTADARAHVTLAPQSFGDFGGLQQPNNYQNQYPSASSNQILFESTDATSSDPMLSLILDDVYSMEQDMKILEDLPDCSPQQTASARETINYIQRQLMSYEPPPPRFVQQPVSYASSPFSAPPAYGVSNSAQQRLRAPLPPNSMNPMGSRLPQYGLPPNLNDLSPQMKQRIYEQRQKVMAAQQQQKRLLLQQKQRQQQGMPDPAPFPDGMGDLLNNTVAPNVTLQRSVSLPEPRYVQQPNSPSQQLSPRGGQFSQQQYYPQSPQQWRPNSLQQQNPMLNAQLSTQASYASQQQQAPARFSGQQRQMVVRSMPSPGSRNSPYPPDSPFHPPSPSLYQQQQPTQQRLPQRNVSIPNRVNSPRGLPSGFGDPILSPQPFNPPAVSTYSPTPSGFSADNNFPSYDQYPILDRNRGNAMTSEYVRQELRAMVGARTQQQHQVQPMPQSSSLSQADFDALGFSLDLGNDGPPTSPGLFGPSLLSVAAGANENQSRTNSPRFQLEEQRPAEQKKSLLQQLLSEPP